MSKNQSRKERKSKKRVRIQKIDQKEVLELVKFITILLDFYF